jgi:hypothetical protein
VQWCARDDKLSYVVHRMMSRPASGLAAPFGGYFTLIDGRGQIAVQYDLKAYSKKIRNVKSNCLDLGLAHE